MISSRAAKAAIAIWLASVAGVVMGEGAGSSTPPLNQIGQVLELGTHEIEQMPRVEVEAVVTLAIARRSYLWVESEGRGIRVHTRNRQFQVQPGDRVRLTGNVIPGENGPMIAPEQITVLGSGPLPLAVPRTAAELNTFEDVNRRVQSEGRILRVVEKSARWQVQLAEGNSHFWIELPRQTNDVIGMLRDARVRVEGVCVRQVFDWGATVEPTLIVQSVSDLRACLKKHG